MIERSSSAQDNIGIVNRYYEEVWNRGDAERLDHFVSRHVIGHDPAIGEFDFALLQQLVVMFHAGFPDFHVTVDDVVAQGERVALRFRSAGTFLGTFMGVTPTGKPMSITGLVMYTFAGGKIVEIRMGWDPASLLRQIEADPVRSHFKG